MHILKFAKKENLNKFHTQLYLLWVLTRWTSAHLQTTDENFPHSALRIICNIFVKKIPNTKFTPNFCLVT